MTHYPAVLREIVAGVGLDGADLEERIASAAVKQGMRELVGDLLERPRGADRVRPPRPA